MRRERVRILGAVAGAIAAACAYVVARAAAIVSLRWLRGLALAVRYAFRVVTLTAYRRCPSCFRAVRREARVCRGCGAGTRRTAGPR